MTSKNGKSKKSSSNRRKKSLCSARTSSDTCASRRPRTRTAPFSIDSILLIAYQTLTRIRRIKKLLGLRNCARVFTARWGATCTPSREGTGRWKSFGLGTVDFFQPLYDKTVGGVAAVSVPKCVGLDFTEDGKQLTVATEDGTVTVLRVKEDGEGTWKSGGADARSFALLKEDVARREEEGVVLCARASKDGKRLLYGGKGQGNDVKIVDVEQEGKLVWKAKPPPVNRLNYRAPPWVKCARFKDRGEANGGNESCVFAVGTGEKKVRLYDTRANKRGDDGSGIRRSAGEFSRF